VTTEDWVFLLDDGMLVSQNWIDDVIKVIENYGNYEYDTNKGKAKIGMISVRPIQPNLLIPDGFIKSAYDWKQWTYEWMDRSIWPSYYLIHDEFFTKYPEWHKGDLTFEMIYDGLNKWYDEEHPELKTTYIPLLQYGLRAMPRASYVSVSSVFAMRRDFWKEMGGFYKGYTFYEAYAEIKAKMVLNWVTLFIHSSPFIHFQGAGTVAFADMVTEYSLKDTNIDSYAGCEKIFGMKLQDLGIIQSEQYVPTRLKQQVHETIDPLLGV